MVRGRIRSQGQCPLSAVHGRPTLVRVLEVLAGRQWPRICDERSSALFRALIESCRDKRFVAFFLPDEIGSAGDADDLRIGAGIDQALAKLERSG